MTVDFAVFCSSGERLSALRVSTPVTTVRVLRLLEAQYRNRTVVAVPAPWRSRAARTLGGKFTVGRTKRLRATRVVRHTHDDRLTSARVERG